MQQGLCSQISKITQSSCYLHEMSADPHVCKDWVHLVMHAKRDEKRWMHKQSSPRTELFVRINDGWRRKIPSSGTDHCLELSSSGCSCEALCDT